MNEGTMLLHDVRNQLSILRPQSKTSQKTVTINKQPRIHKNSYNIKLPAVNRNRSWDADLNV
jgi:hypothetical protein